MPTRNIAPRKGAQVDRRTAVITQFVDLVNQVPDAPEGDITDLLGPLLAAKSWEDLQQSEGIPSSKALAQTHTKVRVDMIAKKVSDKDSLTGYYLLCDAVNLTTGEQFRFTAGGEQAVVVLSQLYVLKALPAYVEFVAVATTSGNDAINAVVLGRDPSTVIDA